MTKTLEAKKMRLIASIIRLKREEEVDALATAIRRFHAKRPRKKGVEEQIFRPMRKRLVMEELAQEQPKQKFDPDEFKHIIRRLDVQEPIEQLMAQLTP